MNWAIFAGGAGMIIYSFLLRRVDIWVYGKDGEETHEYNRPKKLRDKIIRVMFIIMGVFLILVSFAG